MTMLEKVAAAIYESMMVGLSEDEKRSIGFADWTCHDMARAAIEAMREPNDAMVAAVRDPLRANGSALSKGFHDTWQAAVDAILAEPTP